MKHFGNDELAQRVRLVGRADLPGRDGASMRLLAAMAEPRRRGSEMYVSQSARLVMSPYTVETAENDARYFQRRSAEEDQAAADAAGPEARSAHLDLAKRYARLSARTTWPDSTGFARREHLSGLLSRRFALAERAAAGDATETQPVAERKRRLDDRLDEALLETYPASDPVSFAHIG